MVVASATGPAIAPLRGRPRFEDNDAVGGDLLVLGAFDLVDPATFDFLGWGSGQGGPALPLFLVWQNADGGGGVGLGSTSAGALDVIAGDGERRRGSGGVV